MVQLEEALSYKSEGNGFDSRLCPWKFSLIYSFRQRYGHGVSLASKLNELQEYFLQRKCRRCLELKNLPPSCADCHEIWEPQPPGNLWTCPGLYRGCFTLITSAANKNVNTLTFWRRTFFQILAHPVFKM